MTIKRLFQKQLGRKFETLSKEWRAHIRRVDSLPNPRTSASKDPQLESLDSKLFSNAP